MVQTFLLDVRFAELLQYDLPELVRNVTSILVVHALHVIRLLDLLIVLTRDAQLVRFQHLVIVVELAPG